MIETGRARAALVIGADGLTRYLDGDDRGTAMLFGDGAGAVVLTAADPAVGIGPVALHSDRTAATSSASAATTCASAWTARWSSATPSASWSTSPARRSSRRRRARRHRPLRLPPGELADHRRGRPRELGADPARVVDVVGRFANTSAASIPIALSVAAAEPASGRRRHGPPRRVRRRARVGRDGGDLAPGLRPVPGRLPPMSPSLAERLVGAWILESYEADDPDGTVRTPFGPDATGLLVYGADGRMTVQVMDPRRPRWERRAGRGRAPRPGHGRGGRLHRLRRPLRGRGDRRADGHPPRRDQPRPELGRAPAAPHGRARRRPAPPDRPAAEVAGRTAIPRLTWRRDGRGV